MKPLLRLLLLLLLATPAVAAERVRVKVEQENLRTAPAGKILAVVEQGATLEVVGQRGQWLQVRLNGWIWRPIPATEQAQQEAAPTPPSLPRPPVELVTARLEWRPQDFHRGESQKRAHLQATLEFANNSRHTLGAVQYRLVLVDAAGEVLLEQDFDTDLKLPPDQEQSRPVTHLWLERSGPSGEDYRRLRAATQQGPLGLQVELISAYFLETGSTPLAHSP